MNVRKTSPRRNSPRRNSPSRNGSSPYKRSYPDVALIEQDRKALELASVKHELYDLKVGQKNYGDLH